MASMSHDEIVRLNKDHTLTSWSTQKGWNPLTMVRAEGVYFWDGNGKRYIDFASQLVNVNIGYQHPYVIKAIQEQAAKLCYAYPGIATEPRGRLGEMLKEILPGDLSKSFFTLGGSEAVENAMKMARLCTGRQKIVTRYRSYHGATFGAMSAGGDPRRLANEPGVPWIVRVHGPYPYRSPIYRGRTDDEAEAVIGDLMEETILFEGPENVAAILLEGYSGTSGIMQGGEVFWRRVQEICDKYDILLIIDEVMSGFGRTGEWFGIDHYPFVKPDIMAMSKGITGAYVPLGATSVTDEVASYFDDHVFWGGLTCSAHPLGCATAIACLEVYQQENLIERSREMGKVLRAGLMRLADKHPCVGEVRGTGLHHLVELVVNRETRQPMGEWNKPMCEAIGRLSGKLKELGLSTFAKWNYFLCTPPLVITEAHIADALGIIDQALAIADEYTEN